VKNRATGLLERAAGTRKTMPDSDIGVVQCTYELAQVCTIDLVVRGKGEDHVPRGALEASHQCGRLSENTRQVDDGELLAVSQQFIQGARCVGPGPIQNEDELVGNTDGDDPRFVFGIQRLQVGATRSYGDDDGDLGRVIMVCHSYGTSTLDALVRSSNRLG
jgi:hypothetical protein